MNDSDGCFMAIAFVLIVGTVGFMSCNKGRDLGLCEERWKHTATAADTIARVREGCSLPSKTGGAR